MNKRTYKFEEFQFIAVGAAASKDADADNADVGAVHREADGVRGAVARVPRPVLTDVAETRRCRVHRPAGAFINVLQRRQILPIREDFIGYYWLLID